MAKTPVRTKAKSIASRPSPSKPDKTQSASNETGCKFVSEWRLLGSTAGMTQVWIPTKQYKRVAAALSKLTKSESIKAKLRARKMPVGVTSVCSGTCGGGWCKEVDVPQPDSLLTECQCAYFV